MKEERRADACEAKEQGANETHDGRDGRTARPDGNERKVIRMNDDVAARQKIRPSEDRSDHGVEFPEGDVEGRGKPRKVRESRQRDGEPMRPKETPQPE